MRTIGTLLADARRERHFSLEELEKKTRIKTAFIRAIEKEQWEKLPEFAVVHGFVRNLASNLHINTEQALACLRRDYPPKKLIINPRPDLKEKFQWNPRLTFVVGVTSVFLLLSSYLGYQYIQFVQPPELFVDSPQEGEIITESKVLVTGQSDMEAVVRVNNQPVILDEYGNFSTEIEIFEGTHEIEVKSISRSGKENVVRRTIEPKL